MSYSSQIAECSRKISALQKAKGILLSQKAMINQSLNQFAAHDYMQDEFIGQNSDEYNKVVQDHSKSIRNSLNKIHEDNVRQIDTRIQSLQHQIIRLQEQQKLERERLLQIVRR